MNQKIFFGIHFYCDLTTEDHQREVKTSTLPIGTTSRWGEGVFILSPSLRHQTTGWWSEALSDLQHKCFPSKAPHSSEKPSLALADLSAETMVSNQISQFLIKIPRIQVRGFRVDEV